MKAKSFLALLFSAAALMFTTTSCSDDDDDSTSDGGTTTATSITIAPTTLTLSPGGYETLTATLAPTGSTGTISWSSSNSSVASVSDGGLVYAVSEGSATIYATCGSLSATCAVTVGAAETHASLLGSDYYLVSLDYITYDTVADRVVQDLRVDDLNTFLYVWAGYTAGTSSGVNAYGQTESWTCLQVESSSGWSGLGVCVGENGDYTALNALSEITDNADEYYLHIAIKSSTPVSHCIKMESVGSGVCVIGNNGAVDGVAISYPLTTDGEWQHFDIPMTHFTSQGFAFNPSNTASANVFIMLSGAVDGTPLDYDAVFFYKK
ncbi:MAG: Ig-like domain-containing protein [Rikenellaceae bacterium]